MKLVTLSPSLSLHRYEKNATHLFCHQHVHVSVHFPPRLTWLRNRRSINSSSESGLSTSSTISSSIWWGAGECEVSLAVSLVSRFRLALWSSILELCRVRSKSRNSLCCGSGGRGVLWSFSLLLCDWSIRHSSSSSIPSLLGRPSCTVSLLTSLW